MWVAALLHVFVPDRGIGGDDTSSPALLLLSALPWLFFCIIIFHIFKLWQYFSLAKMLYVSGGMHSFTPGSAIE